MTVQEVYKQAKENAPYSLKVMELFIKMGFEEQARLITSLFAAFATTALRSDDRLVGEFINLIEDHYNTFKKKRFVTVECSSCGDKLGVPEEDKDLVHLCPKCFDSKSV